MRKLLLIAGVAALAAPSLALAQDAPSALGAGNHGADSAYSGGPDDVAAREARLDRAIHDADSSGEIAQDDATHDRYLLTTVRTHQDELASEHGALTPDDRATINRELDGVNAHLKLQMGGGF